MYSKCVSCPKLGVSCDGPNFVAMNAAELVAWCNARKDFMKISNARIAEMAGMSKGTVDGFFANAHADFRFETIRPVLRVLVGGEFSGVPCPDPSSGEKAAYEERIRGLEADNARLEEKARDLSKNYDDMKTLITNTNKRNMDSQKFLRNQVKIFSTLFSVSVGIIVLIIMLIIFLE